MSGYRWALSPDWSAVEVSFSNCAEMSVPYRITSQSHRGVIKQTISWNEKKMLLRLVVVEYLRLLKLLEVCSVTKSIIGPSTKKKATEDHKFIVFCSEHPASGNN